jgi:hypothetical protein
VKRRALFLSIASVCALALVTFRLLTRNDQHSSGIDHPAITTDASLPRQMPSFQAPATSSLEPLEIKGGTRPIGKPPLALASNISTQQRADASDRQLLAVKQVLRDYRAAMGENPVGTNSEITRALLGVNSRKARFLPDEARVDHGQLVDRWNHPYFFHQLSRSQIQVRSAGPDGKMWTTDDELSR